MDIKRKDIFDNYWELDERPFLEQEFSKENGVEYADIFSVIMIGQSIEKIEEGDDKSYFSLILSNGLKITVESNEGCGGCENGWFYYDKILTYGDKGNVITNVKVTSATTPTEYDDFYEFQLEIFSLDKRILSTTFSGTDNGYYGIGIKLKCYIEMDTLMDLMEKQGVE